MAKINDEQLKTFKTIVEACGLEQKNIDILHTVFFKYIEDPVVNAALTVIKELLPQIKIFEDTMNSADCNIYKQYISKPHPLVVCDEKQSTTLTIYPNIFIDANISYSNLSHLGPLDATSALSTLIKEYEKDKGGKYAEAKWGTPEKRFRQHDEADTNRILTRLDLGLGDGGAAGDKIRDIAVRLDSIRKPMELLYAETPEDFTIMYGQGGVSSCMAADGGGRAGWQFLTDVGLCPPSFYAYFKYTKGAYLRKNDKVVARCILYKMSKDAEKEVWGYGRVYTNGGEIHDKFLKALKAAGIQELNPDRFIPPNGHQTVIPGVSMEKYMKGVYGAPFPYFDNMDYSGKGFTATWDEEKKEFTLTYHTRVSGSKAIPISGRGGHIRSCDYVTRNCESCGRPTYDRYYGQWLTTDDGHMFCGPQCSVEKNYVEVLDGAGHRHWMTDNKGLIRAQRTGIRFTTMQAARDNGFFPIMQEFGTIPEDTIMEVDNQCIVPGQDRNYYAVVGYRQLLDRNPDFRTIDDVNKFSSNIIPVGSIREQKAVRFDPTESLVEVAA